MEINYVAFDKIPYFSARDKAYQLNIEQFAPYVQYSQIDIDGFKKAIEERQAFDINRDVLVEELFKQYDSLKTAEPSLENIKLLQNSNTFTVTTAHQPSLLTGPLYFILKICSTIQLSKKLQQQYPKYAFVPCFIIGGEDHDFEEINHMYIFNQKIEWQKQATGAVGRLRIENLQESVIDPLKKAFNDTWTTSLLDKIDGLVTEQPDLSYGDFTQWLVHTLFGTYGLVVINFDNKAFKHCFKPLIKKEILHSFSKPFVEQTQEDIAKIGYKKQAHARAINFFYFENNQRLRIERDGESYQLVGSNTRFTESEMLQEIERHPDRFSPNVIMRPLYQETILPNLAYIGGGGELAYWTERKLQFQAANVFFPMLIRRNSALYISKTNQKLLNKLAYSLEDILVPMETALRIRVQSISESTTSFPEELKAIERILSDIKIAVADVDQTLEPKVAAFRKKVQNEFKSLESKLLQRLKQKHEVDLNRIRKLYNSIFPNQGLQERRVNILEIHNDLGHSIIPQLVEACNPLNKDVIVIYA